MKKALLLLFAISCLNVFSQDKKKADSLLSVLKTQKLSIENRALLLADIAFYHPKIDTSLYLAKQSLTLAKAITSPSSMAIAFEEISNNERKLGNLSKSFEASFEALHIYDSLGLVEQQAATFTQLANNYMEDKRYDLAIAYLKEAKDIYALAGKKVKYNYTLLNLGEMYRLQGNLDHAKASFKEVLFNNKNLNDEIAQGYSLGNLGMVFNAQDSLQIAKLYLKNAISILHRLGDSYSTSVYLAELGDLYQKVGDFKAAEKQMLAAFMMAQGAGLKEQVKDFSQKLGNFYESQHNYAKALAYQKLVHIYQDSLINKKQIQEIERIKAGYEIDKRESQIGMLHTLNNTQKKLLWLLAIGGIITFFFAYLFYRGNIQIKKANINLLLLQELNHRVKNNLQMISSLLHLQSQDLSENSVKDALLAGRSRVDALTLVHRKLYQEGVETRISLKEYIKELVLGLFHGYNIPFKPNFEITDASIPLDTAIPLALIINELVVNALKHAYIGVKDPFLVIKLQYVNESLQIQIIDNGNGFLIQEGKKQNSFGLKLIKSLIQQLDGRIKKMEARGTHWVINLK